MDDEFGIYFRPELAAQRVTSAFMALLWRSISLAVSLTIFGLLWAFFPGVFGGWAPWFIGAAVLTGGSTTVYAVICWVRARADARRATRGLAIGVNRSGMMIRGRWITWPEIGSIVVRPGGWGASSALLTSSRDRSDVPVVPLELTDAMPASLDAVVRVLSSGRSWVDMSRLD